MNKYLPIFLILSGIIFSIITVIDYSNHGLVFTVGIWNVIGNIFISVIVIPLLAIVVVFVLKVFLNK